MAWDDTKTANSALSSAEWNAMVTHMKTVINTADVCTASTIDLEEVNKIRFSGDEPTSNQTGNGITVEDVAAGENVGVGEVVYLKSDGEWWRTDADAEATAKGMLGIALETKTDGVNMKTMLKGFYRDDTAFGWTAGDVLYLSTAIGNLTATAPSGSGDIVRVVGYAVTDDLIYFNPDGTYVEIA